MMMLNYCFSFDRIPTLCHLEATCTLNRVQHKPRQRQLKRMLTHTGEQIKIDPTTAVTTAWINPDDVGML